MMSLETIIKKERHLCSTLNEDESELNSLHFLFYFFIRKKPSIIKPLISNDKSGDM